MMRAGSLFATQLNLHAAPNLARKTVFDDKMHHISFILLD
jgi:hypothetical protein